MKTVDDKLHEILNNVILKASRKDEAITKIRKIIESEAVTRSLSIIEYLLKKIIKNEKMDTYKIQKAYHWIEGTKEIEISSENLIYTELATTHSGCQCNNLENSELIRKKCGQIADLIREIEILNVK